MENLSNVCRSAHMVGRLSEALAEVANKQQDDVSDTALISYKNRLVEPSFRCILWQTANQTTSVTQIVLFSADVHYNRGGSLTEYSIQRTLSCMYILLDEVMKVLFKPGPVLTVFHKTPEELGGWTFSSWALNSYPHLLSSTSVIAKCIVNTSIYNLTHF